MEVSTCLLLLEWVQGCLRQWRGEEDFLEVVWEWEDGFCMGRLGGEGAVLCPARLDVLMMLVVLFECGQGVVRDSERSLNVGFFVV